MKKSNIIKKASAILLSSLMLNALASSVSAEQFNNDEITKAFSESDYEYDIMPLYDNVTYIGAGCSVNGSKAECTGSFELYSTKKAVMTVSLMKSTNGVDNWSKVESWSNTYTSVGPNSINVMSTNDLSSNYYYCAVVQVQVYSSSNKVIETVYASSNNVHT